MSFDQKLFRKSYIPCFSPQNGTLIGRKLSEFFKNISIFDDGLDFYEINCLLQNRLKSFLLQKHAFR